MTKFDINDYLKNKNDNKGTCRTCAKVVPWARARVIMHKGSSCQGVSEEEKRFFKEQRTNNVIATTSVIVESSSPVEVTESPVIKRQKVQVLYTLTANCYFTKLLSTSFRFLSTASLTR
jgi:hypothetical protein